MSAALAGRVEGGTQVSGKVVLLGHFRILCYGADCSIVDRQMPHTPAMLFVLTACLAGFDEILTLQWGVSRTGRPFHFVELSAPKEVRLPD